MRPDLHLASLAETSAGIDVVVARVSVLIACTSLVDASCGIFGHGMFIWCGLGGVSLWGGSLGLIAICGCCSLSSVGAL